MLRATLAKRCDVFDAAAIDILHCTLSVPVGQADSRHVDDRIASRNARRCLQLENQHGGTSPGNGIAAMPSVVEGNKRGGSRCDVSRCRGMRFGFGGFPSRGSARFLPSWSHPTPANETSAADNRRTTIAEIERTRMAGYVLARPRVGRLVPVQRVRLKIHLQTPAVAGRRDANGNERERWHITQMARSQKNPRPDERRPFPANARRRPDPCGMLLPAVGRVPVCRLTSAGSSDHAARRHPCGAPQKSLANRAVPRMTA
jgi:hypothetical protein